MNEHIVEGKKVCVSFQKQKVIHHIDFQLSKGKITAIIGESGSGKSITAQSIASLLPPEAVMESGEIFFQHERTNEWTKKHWHEMRGTKISLMFQNTYETLDPLYRISDHFYEFYKAHTNLRKKEIKEQVLLLFKNMQIPDPERTFHSYPFELSGGMRQRVLLALSIALNPDLLIADEPTTALDVHVQAVILHLIKEWQTINKKSVLFITHDLGVVSELADYVIVMKSGKIIEQNTVTNILEHPIHPYTQLLIQEYKNLDIKTVSKQENEPSLPLVSVKNISKSYQTATLFKWSRYKVPAVHHLSFTINQGEIVGILGESGSGKSSLSRLLLQLERPDEGTIMWHKQPILRKDLQWVPQDPSASFNPRFRIADIIGEGLDYNERLSVKEREQLIKQTLRLVGLQEQWYDAYPNQLSGGMLQRIAIARAIILKPKLIVLDEPFASLDLSFQREMIALIRSIHERYHTAFLFISHDIRVASHLCHRIFFMEKGTFVEEIKGHEICNTTHPYSKRLISAIPVLP